MIAHDTKYFQQRQSVCVTVANVHKLNYEIEFVVLKKNILVLLMQIQTMTLCFNSFTMTMKTKLH